MQVRIGNTTWKRGCPGEAPGEKFLQLRIARIIRRDVFTLGIDGVLHHSVRRKHLSPSHTPSTALLLLSHD